jgi:hypothetical protein
MRRTIVFFVAASFTVVACSSSSKSSSTATSTPATTTAPAAPATAAPASTTTIPNAVLQSQLLTLADMPAGWSVDNSASSGGGSIKGCDTKVFGSHPNKAKAAFQAGANGIPSTDETIVGYTDDQAKADYTRVVNHFNACKTFTITTEGKNYSGTVGAMSLGQTYGNQSSAWQFSLDVQGFTLGVDAVLVLKGNENMGLNYDELGTPDLATVQGLVAKATAKMP